MNEPSECFKIFIYLFIICKYTVAVFRHSRREHQISLQIVVSHHVVAGIWTPYLWKSSWVLLHWAISPARIRYSYCLCKINQGKGQQDGPWDPHGRRQWTKFHKLFSDSTHTFVTHKHTLPPPMRQAVSHSSWLHPQPQEQVVVKSSYLTLSFSFLFPSCTREAQLPSCVPSFPLSLLFSGLPVAPWLHLLNVYSSERTFFFLGWQEGPSMRTPSRQKEVLVKDMALWNSQTNNTECWVPQTVLNAESQRDRVWMATGASWEDNNETRWANQVSGLRQENRAIERRGQLSG